MRWEREKGWLQIIIANNQNSDVIIFWRLQERDSKTETWKHISNPINIYSLRQTWSPLDMSPTDCAVSCVHVTLYISHQSFLAFQWYRIIQIVFFCKLYVTERRTIFDACTLYSSLFILYLRTLVWRVLEADMREWENLQSWEQTETMF